MNFHHRFIKASKSKAFDIIHREKLKFNISRYQNAFEKGKLNYENIEVAKDFVSHTKKYSIDHLSSLLITFEKQISSRGTQVIWAFDKNEALSELEKFGRYWRNLEQVNN